MSKPFKFSTIVNSRVTDEDFYDNPLAMYSTDISWWDCFKALFHGRLTIYTVVSCEDTELEKEIDTLCGKHTLEHNATPQRWVPPVDENPVPKLEAGLDLVLERARYRAPYLYVPPVDQKPIPNLIAPMYGASGTNDGTYPSEIPVDKESTDG